MQNKIMPTIKFVFKHLIVSFFHIQPGHIKTLALIQIRKSLNRPLIEIREQLPVLLNHLKLKGNGVEIGVWEGHFSECIIVNSHLAKLFSIDPWKKFDKKEYDDIVNVSQAEFEEIYHSVVGRLKNMGIGAKL